MWNNQDAANSPRHIRQTYRLAPGLRFPAPGRRRNTDMRQFSLRDLDWTLAVGLRGELANFREEEVAFIANDMGMTPQELLFAVSKGPKLPKLLSALGVDPQKLASENPGKMRDLQRICITCSHKDQCHHNLAAGTAAGHYHFCPNAVSLDALFHSK